MDPIKEDHEEELIMETAPDYLLPLNHPGKTSIYEDPPVYPRIGDEYQVQLPPLKMKSPQSPQRSIVTVEKLEHDDSVEIGLPVPVFWVPANGTLEDLKENLYNKEGNNKVALAGLDESGKDQNNGSIVNELHAAENSSCEIPKHDTETLNKTSNDNLQRKCSRYSAVPGSQSTSWSDAEVDNFLLGLYIFGKNLAHVKNFMESKNMGDVLAFYYGEFYKSNAHRKWAECRKSKNKRCVHGQRIFVGWRQNELLSRLLPGVSPEKQNSLLQITKTFNEGGISLENYVVALKVMVGTQAFVEAVGIGKGKHDLTGISLDHVKGNQSPSIHSEIPTGKACSALTSGEIIKFLTGNFRLSKTRSNDLFWEAVWPRLLANGWHSEQPNDQMGALTKNSLVFLIPGIKKFSRSKLVKGEHYFDSVSDVLNKVSSEPMLLMLDIEGEKDNNKTKEVNGELTTCSQPCHFRPRFPDCNSDLMKFMVVDTSIVHGEEPSKIREIRSLPIDTTCNYMSSSSSDGIELNNSSSGHLESGDASLPEQEESYLGTFEDKIAKSHLKRTIDKKMQADHPPIPKKKRIHKQDTNGQVSGHSNEQIPTNTSGQFSQKRKPGKLNYLSPARKRPKEAAFNFSTTGYGTTSFPREHDLKKEMESMDCLLRYPDTIDTIVVKLGTDNETGKGGCPVSHSEINFRGPSYKKYRVKGKSSHLGSLDGIDTINSKFGNHSTSDVCSSRSKTSNRFPSESGTCNYDDRSVCPSSMIDSCVEKTQHRDIIDLNIPQFPPELDTTSVFSAETAESQDTVQINGSSQTETLQHLDDSRPHRDSNVEPSEEHHGLNERRQSTRNRPPTAKALEAVASGYFVRRRSSKPSSRSSRSAQTKIEASSSFLTACKSNITTSRITDSVPMQDEGTFYENGRNF